MTNLLGADVFVAEINCSRCFNRMLYSSSIWIMLPIALLLLIGTLLTIKMIYKKKEINSNY